MSWVANSPKRTAWASESAFRIMQRLIAVSGMKDVILLGDLESMYDARHPLRLYDGTRPSETANRVFLAIGRAIGRELDPSNGDDVTAAISFLSDGLPNTKKHSQSVARTNAGDLLRSPENMGAEQVAWFCANTGVSLDYLRGDTESPEATLEAGSAAELARIYDGISYDRRRALWAVATALMEQDAAEPHTVITP